MPFLMQKGFLLVLKCFKSLFSTILTNCPHGKRCLNVPFSLSCRFVDSRALSVEGTQPSGWYPSYQFSVSSLPQYEKKSFKQLVTCLLGDHFFK